MSEVRVSRTEDPPCYEMQNLHACAHSYNVETHSKNEIEMLGFTQTYFNVITDLNLLQVCKGTLRCAQGLYFFLREGSSISFSR